MTVPNTPYFSLKYNTYAGNTISYVISKSPDMAVYESVEKEFTCNYNKMEIKITTNNEINELCKILTAHQKNQDSVDYVNFFCRHFAEQNQEEILDVFFAPYSHRIETDGYPQYVIDGVFAVDKWGNAFVTNPVNKKNFPWDRISMEVKGNVEDYKIISSYDGQDLIMDAELQKLTTKVFYLLNSEKKTDPLFMVQLPKKVQRWVEKEDPDSIISWDLKPEKKKEIFVPKNYGYYPTPSDVVEMLIENANLEEEMKILEPSAGQGHILEFLKEYDVDCGELFFGNRKILEEKGYSLVFDNFLEYAEYEKYDRIIMNPPFEGQADIDHVNHAYKMLKKGGRLVSVMASSVGFRKNKKSEKFRKLIEQNGYIIELPENSFKESGTSVRTVIVVIDKDE